MLIARLKSETAHQHQRLEQDLDLMRQELKLREYAAMLERFYGFWNPWECRATEALKGSGASVFFAPRRRAHWLVDDLISLGVSAARIEAIPLADRLPPLESEGQVMGSMYVTEGSSLGGQILSRHFASKFGLEEHGCRFFRCYGPNTGAMWREFCEELLRFPDESAEEMIESARNTFDCLHGWLCGERCPSKT